MSFMADVRKRAKHWRAKRDAVAERYGEEYRNLGHPMAKDREKLLKVIDVLITRIGLAGCCTDACPIRPCPLAEDTRAQESLCFKRIEEWAENKAESLKEALDGSSN